jgi:NAD-dependent SIR2 family protein deacetylase
MKNKHCYSIENLLHLGCGNCRGWWTIGDGDPSNPYHCPHCGYQSLTEPAATLESKKENQVFDEVLEQENLPTEPADKRTIVVFSGAGLSAESGIPTFRGNDSLWEQHRVEDVASQDGWIKNRSLVLDFYAQRFEAIKAAEPNLAHKAIARLQEKFNVVNITQNIDDLLERAGC